MSSKCMSHFCIAMTSLSQSFVIWGAYGLTIISKLVYVRTYVHSVNVIFLELSNYFNKKLDTFDKTLTATKI